MKVVKHPERAAWPELLKRPAIDLRELHSRVRPILDEVRANGDAAIRKYTKLFDGVEMDELRVPEDDIRQASALVPSGLREAITLAASNIEKFHRAEIEASNIVETLPGVLCWRWSAPIPRVGLYVPGGSAPLFSTVLMLAIPAKIAGCSEIAVCTPPRRDATVHPAVLHCCGILGIRSVFRAGGAQAIAAMAYGTRTIPKVHKIFGPGNQYVTAAKQLVSAEGVAVDMPAGPSEVAILADATAVPEFVAADMLSQAEHGADSQVLLISDSETLVEETLREIDAQLARLPRREIAATALDHSLAIIVSSIGEGIDIVNEHAPEHLIISTEDPRSAAVNVANAGSVFLGNWSPEAAGDYASGTNHTLPTGGAAFARSGVSTRSFMKRITFQELTREGLRGLGPAVEEMASAEGLYGHRNAVTARLRRMEKEKDGV